MFFVFPVDTSSSIQLSSITHLSIVNFRISQPFLAAFPRVDQVTLALVLEPEENAQMQLQYTPRDIVSFTSTAPASIERFTVTITNGTPDLVQPVAEKLPNFTHLSFVWYPGTDVARGGVEITDASQNLVSLFLCFALYPRRCPGSPHSFPCAATRPSFGTRLRPDRWPPPWHRPPSSLINN